MHRSVNRLRSIARLCLAAVLVHLSALTGCSPPAALASVASQNAANSQALAANIGALADSTRAAARTQSDSIVQRARERVAADLIRLRATILPDHPTESDLMQADAAWTTSLVRASEALAVRLNGALPVDRPVAADLLADAHPATIDLAIAAPGFTSFRVLHDAVAIDRLNEAIQSESSPPIRAGLLTQRSAILDPYLPVRRADATARQYLAALERHLTVIDEQSRIAGMHAGAVLSAAQPAPRPDALAIYRDPDLRSAVIDLVAQASGPQAAQRLRDQLIAIDDAVTARGP